MIITSGQERWGKVLFSVLSVCLFRGVPMCTATFSPPPRTWDLTVRLQTIKKSLGIKLHCSQLKVAFLEYITEMRVLAGKVMVDISIYLDHSRLVKCLLEGRTGWRIIETRYLVDFIYLKQECIPVGCVPSAVVAVCLGVGGVCPGGCLSRGHVCPGDVHLPPRGQTDACEFITFPQRMLRTVKNPWNPKQEPLVISVMLIVVYHYLSFRTLKWMCEFLHE